MFNTAIVLKSLPMLLEASIWTVVYSLSSVAIGFCIGTLMCAAGLSRSPVMRRIAAFYVSFFRGVPLLVQLLIAYYCLPLIGVNVPSSLAAVGTLALCTGAYNAEILRGGFLGIPPGLIEAARMVGLSHAQILTRIQVPLAVRLDAALAGQRDHDDGEGLLADLGGRRAGADAARPEHRHLDLPAAGDLRHGGHHLFHHQWRDLAARHG